MKNTLEFLAKHTGKTYTEKEALAITSLSLWGKEIVDISSLAGLKNLEILYLWCNKIVDISSLAGLTNLTYLNLGGNKIVDIIAKQKLAKALYKTNITF